MKKNHDYRTIRFAAAALLCPALLCLLLSACGGKAPQETTSAAAAESTSAAETSAAAGLANPWHDITEEEAQKHCERLFKAPDGAENQRWSMMEEAGDSSKAPLIQLKFDLDGLSYTARAQMGASETDDISGMHYNWDTTFDSTLAGWGEGRMASKSYRAVGEKETADLCTWYDIEIGIAYSLAVTAPDLDGFDIRAIAEAMYRES